jgi:protein O-mannosyl-transferase
MAIHKQTTLFLSLFLILGSILTYINILRNGLFFDDEELIYRNEYVTNLYNLPKLYSTNMIAGAGKVSNMYRPFLMTTFALNHAVGGNNPVGYHLFSIILHAANVVLVFLLLMKLFNNTTLGFITSLLYAVHPVQSEAISYASGRTDPLVAFFILISLHLFFRFITDKRNYLSGIGTIISLIFAVLSKEIAIVLPFLYLIILIPIHHKMNVFKSRMYGIITVSFTIIGIYTLLRLTILNFANTLNFYQTPTPYSQHISIRILTFCEALFQYLGVYMYPITLNVARTVNPITTFLNPTVLLISSILFVSFTLAIWRFRRRDPVPLFCLLMFFIPLFPASGIIPINNIVGEHYLYVPSLGFFLFVAYVFLYIVKRFNNTETRLILMMAGCTIVLLFSVRTILRTYDWHDPIVFYEKHLLLSPDNVPMRNNLAMAYDEAGQTAQAIQQYKYILQYSDVYPQVHHNLAESYLKLGQTQDAEREYLNAIKLDPSFRFSYISLAQLYEKTNQKEKLKAIEEKINQLPQL